MEETQRTERFEVAGTSVGVGDLVEFTYGNGTATTAIFRGMHTDPRYVLGVVSTGVLAIPISADCELRSVRVLEGLDYPVGTVLIDGPGNAFQRKSDGLWHMASEGESTGITSAALRIFFGPMRLVYMPEGDGK